MTQMNRRAFAASLVALPAGAAIATAPTFMGAGVASAKSTSALKAVAPLAQIRVGRFTVTALNDGHVDMPFNYFTGREPGEVEASAKRLAMAQPGGLRLSFNQFLIDDGSQRVLIDTGPAGTFGETGRLPNGLEQLGLKPSDIGAVILTHMHLDHISGLVVGGKKVFSDAEVYVDRRDLAYWTDQGRRASAPEFLHSSFDAAQKVASLYPGLNSIDGEREIVSGISIVDLAGHTPGHVGVRISDAGDSLIMTSDMLFHPAVHPEASDIGFVFEQDPAAARTMRERFLPQAYDEKALIASTHMPFPGLGRVIKDRGALRWQPEAWAERG